LTLFETIDSQYLNTLDYLTLLGEDNARPQWYGHDFVPNQGVREGPTTDMAVVYARPDARVKVLMSTGLVGVKYLLAGASSQANPSDEAALGSGYPVKLGRVTRPRFHVARDLWAIDESRLQGLRRFGIRNERLAELHAAAGACLEEARTQFAAGQYHKAVAASREAWGLEARAYPEVKATANDTVRGVVFYLVLLLPFSFFMERLLFGFATIRKQILGFAGVFGLAFAVLHAVHPAFKLGSSPYVILLAFVIFALGAFVLVVVMRKFTAEMRHIRAQHTGRVDVDIDRVSASMAALLLGVSNLRKRKLRTALTAGTLVLLTFAALSFTSVKTYLDLRRTLRPYPASYAGVMVRDRSWAGLQSSVLPHLESAFADIATVAPRARLTGWAPSKKAHLKVSAPSTGRFTFAQGVAGLTPDEAHLSRPDRCLAPGGRWLAPGERDACILSTHQAKLLGIDASQVGTVRVRLLGRDLRVVGLFDGEKLDALADLDGEPLAPINPETAGAGRAGLGAPDVEALKPLRTFPHLSAANVVILPYQTTMELGGVLASVGVGRFRVDDPMPRVRRFLRRIGLAVFVAEADQVALYSAIGRTALTNTSALLVPMLLVGMIVFNTMMGSVYERTREIAIFSSVGLAPLHIGAVFLAEAAVFATVGAVLGYLLGQVGALLLNHLGWGSGMFMNYSALSTVTSTLVVMLTVFLSAIYPARMAAALSVPDVSRKFELPEPDGDCWTFEFPFTLGRRDAIGLYTFLASIFQSFSEGSMGGFIAEHVRMTCSGAQGESEYCITMTTWLAPYDLGVSQTVRLATCATQEPDILAVDVRLDRLSGDVSTWKRLNRPFLTVLRKQFLVWRTVGADEKARYDQQGRAVLAESEC
jgi:FtsX-like permease family protein